MERKGLIFKILGKKMCPGFFRAVQQNRTFNPSAFRSICLAEILNLGSRSVWFKSLLASLFVSKQVCMDRFPRCCRRGAHQALMLFFFPLLRVPSRRPRCFLNVLPFISHVNLSGPSALCRGAGFFAGPARRNRRAAEPTKFGMGKTPGAMSLT